MLISLSVLESICVAVPEFTPNNTQYNLNKN